MIKYQINNLAQFKQYTKYCNIKNQLKKLKLGFCHLEKKTVILKLLNGKIKKLRKTL